jgi:signal transduction histidine kinase
MRMGVTRALRDFSVEVPEVGGEVDFAVSEAETGEQALELIAESPPDILLLDHKLPGITGLDVLDQLSPQNLDMHTVMITAYASIETAVRATKRGAYDFLPKPFTPAELKVTITKAARHLILALQAKKLSEEKRRVRFEFISVLAHELKAPINAIEGYINILAAGTTADNPEVQGQIIGRCSTRIVGMRKLISDLLDLTRIESGQKPRQIAEVDVRKAAETTIETYTPEAQGRDITLGLDAEPSVSFLGDQSEIEIIFNNLVSNAVKYNRDGGRVDISIKRNDDAVVIAVSDTGIGMAKEEAAKLFGDFVRIKNEKTQGILGSGLGLSILKKLAQLYHGEVKVTSAPDVGTTFTVVLRHTSVEEQPE